MTKRPPGKPLTRARSEWEPDRGIEILGVVEAVWRRNVGDGRLTVIVGLEPKGWHMSISHADHRGQPRRYPRWDEIAEARYSLVPADVSMVMFLPPPSEYVAVHDTTFHLHELREADP
jgi:hypothetical protein